jgi:Protein of unknown function (DUF2726)
MNQEIIPSLICLMLFIVFGVLGLFVLVIIYTGPRRAKKLRIPVEKKDAVPYKFPSYEAEIEKPKAERLPYRVRDNFLSEAEHSFYLVLRHTLDSEFTICPKVRLLDIFYITGNTYNHAPRNKIDRKHIDFLICKAQTMKPLLAIELDDSSHKRPDRVERDIFVNQIFEDARLPLLRIKTREAYNTGDLSKELDRYLKVKVS